MFSISHALWDVLGRRGQRLGFTKEIMSKICVPVLCSGHLEAPDQAGCSPGVNWCLAP